MTDRYFDPQTLGHMSADISLGIRPAVEPETNLALLREIQQMRASPQANGLFGAPEKIAKKRPWWRFGPFA